MLLYWPSSSSSSVVWIWKKTRFSSKTNTIYVVSQIVWKPNSIVQLHQNIFIEWLECFGLSRKWIALVFIYLFSLWINVRKHNNNDNDSRNQWCECSNRIDVSRNELCCYRRLFFFFFWFGLVFLELWIGIFVLDLSVCMCVCGSSFQSLLSSSWDNIIL